MGLIANYSNKTMNQCIQNPVHIPQDLRPPRLTYYCVNIIIIQISYTVRIPIFRLVDLYHVTLGYDETTSLTALSWCNSRGVNSIHHCHYTMASADSKFDVCSVFNLNNKNVNTLIARELLGFTCTRSLTMNLKFF